MAGISSYLKSIQENEIVLFLIPEIRMPKEEIEIIKRMTKSGYYIVYINATKPYSTMANVFKNAGIALEKVFFIDLVTKLVGMDIQRVGNCVFCSPQSLTDIGILVQTTVESIPKNSKKMLYFDSLSTLMLYNESETVTRFSHSIIAKLREWDVKGIILVLEQEADKKMISQLSSFCDVTVKM